VLLKAGFDVKFVTGTKKDPTFGGYLVTPDGQKIRIIFGDNLWRLPMWSDPVRYINDETSPVNRNTLALVPTAAALEALTQPSLPDQEAMQLVHDMWCHLFEAVFALDCDFRRGHRRAAAAPPPAADRHLGWGHRRLHLSFRSQRWSKSSRHGVGEASREAS
jgi:hypothetical protein